MVTINSIKKGIVIDHITAGLGIKIFNYLNLDCVNYTVALIMNAPSKKRGEKDIIKIENEVDIDYTVLGLIDPELTVNIIKDEVIVKKIKPELPERVENVVKCRNPRCITSVESYVPHIFKLVDREKRQYKCEYCDDIIKPEDF
jgi:aspartate carbamoyltransferase regulatory subunit